MIPVWYSSGSNYSNNNDDSDNSDKTILCALRRFGIRISEWVYSIPQSPHRSWIWIPQKSLFLGIKYVWCIGNWKYCISHYSSFQQLDNFIYEYRNTSFHAGENTEKIETNVFFRFSTISFWLYTFCWPNKKLKFWTLNSVFFLVKMFAHSNRRKMCANGHTNC